MCWACIEDVDTDNSAVQEIHPASEKDTVYPPVDTGMQEFSPDAENAGVLAPLEKDKGRQELNPDVEKDRVILPIEEDKEDRAMAIGNCEDYGLKTVDNHILSVVSTLRFSI